ncbi:MAG: hypothetical protein HYR96_04970 [Deltaproteobacteria bacterium]|nr:hypothetical protein [Deltaproteobacteria bacterium]MBI3294560.1 hypothetical protein [Deltaproteobacteria bacterium]
MAELFKVSSPTRVDLAGGTGDLWPLYCLLPHSAKTINLALTLAQQVTFEWIEAREFSMRVFSGAASAELKTPLERAQLPLVRPELQFPVFVLSEALREATGIPKIALQVHLQSEVPVGSGLGGSSALCVALTRGITRIIGGFSEQGWQWAMLPWVRDVEARFLQTATGTQDYLAALFGGLSCFISKLGGIERSAYPEETATAVAERMVVVFSGQMHQSGLSNWEIFKKALEGDKEILKGLSAINDVAGSLDRELRLARHDWKAIGQLLNAEWRVRRELFRVNTPRLDELIGFLQQQSILGAKVCGAAAGGSILILCEPIQRARLKESCEKKSVRILDCHTSSEGVSIRT